MLNEFPVRKLLYLSRHKMVAWTRAVVKIMGGVDRFMK